jgi:TnsA endonuclease N terminal
MTTGQSKFEYRKSTKLICWGGSFDSLTELKFALSVREEYAFIRGRVTIHYHPGTKQPTDYIRECHRHYTPDFLIRHKQTGEAFLVEIKPRAFQGDPQLDLRKQVAENYIQWKNYDWKYKVVFDDEIRLTTAQLEEFERCCTLKSASARKIWFAEYNKKVDRSAAPLFSGSVRNDDLHFLFYGHHKKSCFKK